jgi:hypothetical protein
MTADSEGRKRPRMSLARRGTIALGLFVSTWPAGALARSDYRWTSGPDMGGSPLWSKTYDSLS